MSDFESNEDDSDEEDESEEVHTEEYYEEKFKRKIHPKILKKYGKEIHNKIVDLQHILEERRHKVKIKELKDEEWVAEWKIEKLDKEAEKRQWTEEQVKKDIGNRLDITKNYVFYKKGLSKEEIEVLIEEGYEQVNEYDLNYQKIIPVLIKPPMNHSKTHTFLVWSLKKLLERIDGITNIVDHETKFADLTFMYKKKYYALEAEIGSLLRKKEQANQKIRFLNSKYPKRWMFIVSNKNLVHEYRKLGPTAQRNSVEEKLLKMLKF